MSVEIPPVTSQQFPRSIGMSPGGPALPSSTLRVMFSRGRPIELAWSGYALEPSIVHAAMLQLSPREEPAPGDIALCDIDGWGDLRRILQRLPDGAFNTAIDAWPRGRERVERRQILAVVQGARGAGGRRGRLIAALFPCWSRVAALLHFRRRILEAPRFGAAGGDSVKRKYEGQVAEYNAMIERPADVESLELLCRRLAPGARVLVAGSGAGAEVIALHRSGYRAAGFDFAPAMIEAALRNAAAAGVTAQMFLAEMSSLALPDRQFDAVYVTSLVYSFVPGRLRRLECLRRLGRHLVPGGPIIFSFQRLRSLPQLIELTAAWIRADRLDQPIEFGDWYTSFLTSEGRIGKSFIHLFPVHSVMAEARAAGFGRVERCGLSHLLAADFAAPGDG